MATSRGESDGGGKVRFKNWTRRPLTSADQESCTERRRWGLTEGGRGGGSYQEELLEGGVAGRVWNVRQSKVCSQFWALSELRPPRLQVSPEVSHGLLPVPRLREGGRERGAESVYTRYIAALTAGWVAK